MVPERNVLMLVLVRSICDGQGAELSSFDYRK